MLSSTLLMPTVYISTNGLQSPFIETFSKSSLIVCIGHSTFSMSELEIINLRCRWLIHFVFFSFSLTNFEVSQVELLKLQINHNSGGYLAKKGKLRENVSMN